jgi:MFS family permease
MQILDGFRKRALRNPEWLIYVAFFSFQLPVHAMQPIVSLYMASLGAEPSTIGLLLGVAGSVSLVLAAPLGRMSDRIAASRQVLIGGMICILAFVGLSKIASLIGVGVFLGLVMFGHTATVLAYQSAVGSDGIGSERVQAFGWLAATISFAQSLGPPAAGIIVDKSGISTAFGLSAVAAGLSLIGVPILRARESSHYRPDAPGESMERRVVWWRNRGLLHASSSSLLSSLSLNVRLSFLPLFLAAAGSTTTQIGILFSVQAVASLAVRSQIGGLTKRFGTSRMITAVFLLSTVGLAVVPLLANLVQFVVVCVIFGLANGIVHPITMALAADSVPNHQKGMALGIRYSAFRLGNVASPLALGLAAGLWGLSAAFLAAAAFSAVGAAGGIIHELESDHGSEAKIVHSE